MHISFNPALGETVSAIVPPHRSTVQLLFTATLSPTDYEEYSRKGLRVELWSESAGTQKWSALPFVEHKSPQREETLQNSAPMFSLVRGGGEDIAAHKTCTLFLSFSVPFPSQRRIAYTYRLVYPSGEIKWLGHTSNNGTLAFDTALSFGSGWSTRIDDNSEVHYWSAHGMQLDGVEVARLNSGLQCAILALGQDRFVLCLRVFLKYYYSTAFRSWVSDSPTGLSLVFFVSTNTIAPSPTFVLSASSDSSISLTTAGAITVTGSGTSSLLLQTYHPGSELKTFINRSLSHTTLDCKLLSCQPGLAHVVLTSPENTCPVFGFIVPFFPEETQIRNISIPVHCLTALCQDAPQFCIFSTVHLRARFFNVDIETPESETISFTVGTTGGDFVFAPVHLLGNGDKAWEVAVLSPYSPMASQRNSGNVLPTPPESPRLHPIAHLSSPTASVPSLTDAGISRHDKTNTTPWTSLVVSSYRYLTRPLVWLMRRSFTPITMFLNFWLHTLLGSLSRSRVSNASDRRLLQPTACDGEGETSTVSDSCVNPVLHSEQPTARLTIPQSTQLHVNAHSATISILLRPRDTKASVEDVEVALDGSVADCKRKEIDDGIFFVSFDTFANGGRVSVSVR